jgi:hypothetical protein
MGGDLDVASVPGAGSAFVLVLSGPATIEPAVIAEALERALADEEVGLEERAVLRAISGRSRGEGSPGDDSGGPNLRLVGGRGNGRPVGRATDAPPGKSTPA